MNYIDKVYSFVISISTAKISVTINQTWSFHLPTYIGWTFSTEDAPSVYELQQGVDDLLPHWGPEATGISYDVHLLVDVAGPLGLYRVRWAAVNWGLKLNG